MKTIPLVTILALVLSSCCPDCRECKLSLKYDWKIPAHGMDIINIRNDTLIASQNYYGDNLTLYVKDSGHYVLNKTDGSIADTLIGYIPDFAGNKSVSKLGNTETGLFIFKTAKSQFTVAENIRGNKIVLQEWYKNIRAPNNHLFSVQVYYHNKLIQEHCLPPFYDFTYDNSAFYIFTGQNIYRFNFEDTIERI